MNNTTEFSITKALEFVGDNSSYQKSRLLYLMFVVLIYAVMNSHVPFILSASDTILFIIASGLGQIICPIYMGLNTICMCMIVTSCIGIVCLILNKFLLLLSILAFGFFGRGLYASSLIYINEIGGERFIAWSCIAIFGTWGIAPLVLAL